LILCKDTLSVRLFGETLEQLAIYPHFCSDALEACGLLSRQKFEALIVDLCLGAEAEMVLEQVRLSPSNHTAVTFAISPNHAAILPGIQGRVTFVFPRPVSGASVTSVLRAAYGLIMRERRRYFRCPLDVTVIIRTGQMPDMVGAASNVSEGGMAVSGPVAVERGLPVKLYFSLPESTRRLSAEAIVRWRSNQGLVGLEFLYVSDTDRTQLHEWLARRLDATLPESVAEQFRNAGKS
jgi:hypothetical protein